MRITEKKINKLSQLDRIEFRQLKKDIDEKYNTSVTFHYLKTCLFVMIGVIGFAVLCILIKPEVTLQMKELVNAVKHIFLIVPIGFLVDFICSCIRKKKTEELENKFFKLTKRK